MKAVNQQLIFDDVKGLSLSPYGVCWSAVSGRIATMRAKGTHPFEYPAEGMLM